MAYIGIVLLNLWLYIFTYIYIVGGGVCFNFTKKHGGFPYKNITNKIISPNSHKTYHP